MGDKLTSLSLIELVESKTNPRKTFPEESLKELAESIKQNGIINPLLVRILPGGEYEIIDGARRYRSAELAGLKQVPAIIRDISDEQVQVVQLISFLQSEDIHPLDEAEAYKKLIDTNQDVPAIAVKIGKSMSYVKQRLQMLNLTDDWKKHFRNGVMNPAHALLLSRLQPKDQGKCLESYNVIHEYISHGKKSYAMQPIANLRDYIQNNFHLELNKTSFNKKDPNLFKQAGSCTECPKRTGHNKELFNDITNEDICTDPHCFHKKINNHLTAVLKTADEDKEHEYVKIADSYSSHKEVLNPYEYNKAKKGDKGAKKAIVVDGLNAGQVRYIKIKQSHTSSAGKSSTSKPKTTAQIAREKKKAEEVKLKQGTQKRIRCAILKEAKAGIKKFATEDLVKIAKIIEEENYYNDEELAMIILGITDLPEDFDSEPFYKKMKDAELIKVIVLLLVSNDWHNNDNTKLAKATGVNYKKIEKQIKVEMENEKKEEKKAEEKPKSKKTK